MKILSLLPPGLLLLQAFFCNQVARRTCKNVCDAKNIFVLRAIHFSIGHFSFVDFFVLKAASSRMSAIPMSLTLGTSISDQLQY
jgi:hypothetical protein